MGHIVILASSLRSIVDVYPQLEELLNQSEAWKSYIELDFAQIKKIEATPMGAPSDEGESRELDQMVRLSTQRMTCISS